MKKYFTPLIYLFSLLFTSSCISDTISQDFPTVDSNQQLVNFLVSVSGAQNKSTRALSENDENMVKTIEVLLFDEDGIYTYMPIFNSNITQQADGKLSFTIKVPVGTHNMLVMANSRSIVTDIMSQITAGKTKKEQVLDRLVLMNTSMWVVNPDDSSYKHIPMSGEISRLVVSGDKPIIQGVTLVRMLSKVEVKLSELSKEKFNLKDIRLYNYSEKGQVAPNTETWNSDFNAVLTASLPDNYKSPLGSNILYDGSMIHKVGDRGVGCQNVIYTPEAERGTGDNNMEQNVCLVLGGIYEDDTEPTYYRVDIASKVNSIISYMEIKRNHQYVMLIKDIKGPGFTDPEEAYKSRPVNIEANVVEWNNGGLDDIIFDGQNILSVSQDKFTFSKEARNIDSKDNSLFITTDYSTGWVIDKIVDEAGDNIDWLNLSISKGGAEKTETKLLLTENGNNVSRRGYIHISAGRLRYIVEVEQLETSDLSLVITNDENVEIVSLDFISIDGKGVSSQNYKVKWSPTTLPLSFLVTPYLGDGFRFDTTSGYDEIINEQSPVIGGEKAYTIKAKDFTNSELKQNPFQVRSSILVYSLFDKGFSLNKTITLNHRALNLLHNEAEFYDLNGEMHAFHIRTNMPYTVEKISDENNVLTLLTTSGEVDTSEKGTPIYFDLINDEEGVIGETIVTLLIKSPINQFEPQEVLINCKSTGRFIEKPANCYMLQPGEGAIKIPISRCNEWIKDSANPAGMYVLDKDEEFGAIFIWTDNKYGMDEKSAIQSISVEGKGPSGYLVVEPGNDTGNAVIGITNKDGQILWSWHIWVSQYIPSSTAKKGELMERNLGATSDLPITSTNYTAYGLYYQWGRKDPLKGDPYWDYYDSEGKVINLKNYYTFEGTNNLHNTIQNPNKFYYAGKVTECSWYSTSLNVNTLLWNPKEKTIYDPCPEG